VHQAGRNVSGIVCWQLAIERLAVDAGDDQGEQIATSNAGAVNGRLLSGADRAELRLDIDCPAADNIVCISAHDKRQASFSFFLKIADNFIYHPPAPALPKFPFLPHYPEHERRSDTIRPLRVRTTN
jgi:hypothetical protein